MPAIHEILKQYWGFGTFRPLQQEIIESVLAGKDTLALLPTGGGKSICFQVPALAREGICIVISPLIALMKDQVYNLSRRGINAKAIFSGMGKREIDLTLDNCIYGHTKILYVSPERLKTELFIERLKKMKVNLLAIDEAHCISQWGYDFRPPYLEIALVREYMPGVPVLALTASATEKVQQDIMDKLEFQNRQLFRKSFKRENLSYSVFYEENKPGRLLKIMKNVPGTGIIYVRSRRKTKEVAALLQKRGIKADFYHAGLSAEMRNKKQEAWINGSTRVVACTNAFGMGIDKPDVRFVVHLDLPESMEAYYQEAGRAGRDGKRSFAVVLHDHADIQGLQQYASQKFPAKAVIEKTYNALAHYYQLATGGGEGFSYDLDIEDLCKTFNLDIRETYNALKVLESEGYLALTESVFLSSRVRVTADRTQLYDFEIKNRQLSPLVKLILRSYEGALDHYVKINEKRLAQQMGWGQDTLQQNLVKTEKAGILNYEPAKEKPQLTFLSDRVKSGNLKIDYAFMKERKKIYESQVAAVVQYAENMSLCRSRELLRYFDEKDTEDCGICDICLGKKRLALQQEEFEAIATLLQSKLAAPIAIRQLTGSIKGHKEDRVVQVVRWLMDQGRIRENEQHELEWVGKGV